MSNTVEPENERVSVVETVRPPRATTSACEDCGVCDKCRRKETQQKELVLKYGAKHVIMLFVPVTACMIFVIISLKIVTSYQSSDGVNLYYAPLSEDTQQTSTKFWNSLGNASIFIAVVVVMTILLVLLYKYRCYKCMHAWLCFSSLVLLFLMTFVFVSELTKRLNIVIDFLTLFILLWNFGCIGMMCIHWVGPLVLQQIYLILVCSQMALIFIKYLPEWTTWLLLGFISAWDLIAVLCPFGPLNMLVKTAQERNEKFLPALVYSSTVMYPLISMATGNDTTGGETEKNELLKGRSTSDSASSSRETTASPENINLRSIADQQEQAANLLTPDDVQQSPDVVNTTVQSNGSVPRREGEQPKEEEEDGVKLGLGDFIFYSILVGKASILSDWNTVIACFVAVLIGLSFTLFLLAIYRKALPALPISLTFGLIFYFCTNLAVRPFYDEISAKQYFI